MPGGGHHVADGDASIEGKRHERDAEHVGAHPESGSGEVGDEIESAVDLAGGDGAAAVLMDAAGLPAARSGGDGVGGACGDGHVVGHVRFAVGEAEGLVLVDAGAVLDPGVEALVIVCLVYDINMVLGLDLKSMVLLALSTFTVMLSLNQGKTNILYGIVLLVNLAAYVFTVIVP